MDDNTGAWMVRTGLDKMLLQMNKESMMIPQVEQISANFQKFITDTGTFYFSYQTCIAFKLLGGPLVVHENVWSNTTGKHLNQIDGGDKSSRVNRAEFDRLLGE